MKPAGSRKPLTQSRALYCLIINQCATPGLGSIIARRYRAGFGQLALALIGFIMVVSWMVNYFYVKISRLTQDLPEDPNADFKLFKIGWIIFGLAWLWAWPTSISIMREAKQNEENEVKAPPKLR